MNPVTRPLMMEPPPWPALLDDIPILYEDEDEEECEMGEAYLHSVAIQILFACVEAHLRTHWPQLRAFTDMNCYYLEGPLNKRGSKPYVSPDIMIVEPFQPLPRSQVSYTIGKDGPPPRIAMEVMSERSADHRDLQEKVDIYRKLGVHEYILVDMTGRFLSERLLLKQLQPDGTWKDQQGAESGVTSELGFRLVIDDEGDLAVLDARTAKRYVRPEEAEAEAEARHQAEKAQRRAEEAQRQAEEAQRQAEEAQRQAEERAQVEAVRARTEAERAQAEAEARRLAEAQVQALQAELERLRRPPEQGNP